MIAEAPHVRNGVQTLEYLRCASTVREAEITIYGNTIPERILPQFRYQDIFSVAVTEEVASFGSHLGPRSNADG